MLKFIKFLVGLAAALLLLVVGGAYLLPAEVQFSRAAQINAPPEKVFAIINSYKRFNEWSPWASLDPKMTFTFSGPEAGVGAGMTWASNDPSVGTGSQVITASEAPSHLSVDLNFGEMGTSQSEWHLKAENGGTLATWSFKMKADGVLSRWTGLLMEKFVGPDYEKGLSKLKALAEKEAANG